jgi:hypothetical protein
LLDLEQETNIKAASGLWCLIQVASQPERQVAGIKLQLVKVSKKQKLLVLSLLSLHLEIAWIVQTSTSSWLLAY